MPSLSPPNDPFERFEHDEGAMAATETFGARRKPFPETPATEHGDALNGKAISEAPKLTPLAPQALSSHGAQLDAYSENYELDADLAAFLDAGLNQEPSLIEDSSIRPQLKLYDVAQNSAEPAMLKSRTAHTSDMEAPPHSTQRNDPVASTDHAASRAVAEARAPLAQEMPISASDAELDKMLGAISIPRITIHFFLERESSLKACELAAEDRRMTRAHCLVRSGGIHEAIATYQIEPTPSLLVVESRSDSATLLAELNQLAETCDSGTKVVVIGAHNDILLFRELMSRGVSDYVVGPVRTLQVISIIGQLFNDPETPFVGRNLSFVGARGGAGSSTLSHNFAFLLSEMMRANTVIVDYDLAFGTAGLDFNQDPVQGISDALSEPERLDRTLLDRMLTKCSDHLSLFSAPATLDQDYLADDHAYSEVSRVVRSSAPYIVLDLPHLWTPWMKQSMISSDEVIIVATPDLASLRNAKNIVDILRAARPNDHEPRLVLNQTEMPGRPEIPEKEFTSALGLLPSASIPFDAKLFGTSANNAQMLSQCDPNAKAVEGLNQLLGQITGRSFTPKPKSSFFDSLFKKRS